MALELNYPDAEKYLQLIITSVSGVETDPAAVSEEAGHMAPMERPDAVAAEMLRWLDTKN
jgi:pimeloyl-ACP methyl ester carboxylesterase